MTFRKVSFGKMSGYRNRSCVTQLLSVFHTIGGRGDLDQAFSQKDVRASLDGFGRNIGRLWTPKILKGKKITSVFNERSFDKSFFDFFDFYRTVDNLNLLIVYCTYNKTPKLAAAVQLLLEGKNITLT